MTLQEDASASHGNEYLEETHVAAQAVARDAAAEDAAVVVKMG
eukprot:CAMPEP_0181211206 /NCGR_PEP_ID=MMETSP1096-20121128/23656_1 /TAXON_ID=156174 ORGANISM="Chrysochromulina ericina, Strain CCMP281" /NCGR_SAMPLE_ID=MMETSP1096 /ASSEMBLY_ACC=CAM_ASM_000453 /LENGTH=42 /DNA_ID= /DNA_START= /DNA_END= /DNA_ORIENTATION=